MDIDVKELLLEIADSQGARRDTKAGQGMYSCVFCSSGHRGAGSTGAMHIYRDRNGTMRFKCFACGEGGTAIEMYAKKHGMSCNSNDRIAIAKVCKAIKEDFGISSDDDYNRFKESYQYHSKIDEITQEEIKPRKDYSKFFNFALSNQGKAIKYLLSRGIEHAEELSQSFQIGYTDSYKYNGGNDETPAIIIPLSDWSYFWRSTQNGERRHQGTKYILNHGLINQNIDYCIIVESAIDCLSCLDLGFNAIGLNATSMIDKLFREYDLNKNTVYIWALDNDEAGRKATIQAETLSKQYRIPYLIADSNYLFCGCKDTNDAIRYDRHALAEHLNYYRNEALKLDKEKFTRPLEPNQEVSSIPKSEPTINFENILTAEVLDYMLTLTKETDIALYAQKIKDKARELRKPIKEVESLVGIYKKQALAGLKKERSSGGGRYPDYIKVGDNGKPYQTIENCLSILRNDAPYKGKISLNEFSNKTMFGGEQWKDENFSRLVDYVESNYCITKENKIRHALIIEASDNKYHPIKDYLNSVTWDGVPRLSTLFIDFLGAEDNEYTRAVAITTMAGAVARVLNPGIKYDTMPVLVGSQGVGKSTLWAKLGGAWFSDTLDTIKGKEAYESIQNAWIVEIAELSAMAHATKEDVKKFITKTSDRYRKPYAETVEEIPRQCIFVGTTNDYGFLKDETGNRRFYPIDVGVKPATKSIWNDLTQDYINQLWAEAKAIYLRNGSDAIYIKDERMLQMASQQQEEHYGKDTTYSEVEAYLSMPVPPDWDTYDMAQRQDFIAKYRKNPEHTYATEIRKMICVREILNDLYPDSYPISERIPLKDSYEIGKILTSLGWEQTTSHRTRLFLKQRMFTKRKK